MKIPVEATFHDLLICATCPNLKSKGGEIVCDSVHNTRKFKFDTLIKDSCHWHRLEF